MLIIISAVWKIIISSMCCLTFFFSLYTWHSAAMKKKETIGSDKLIAVVDDTVIQSLREN